MLILIMCCYVNHPFLWLLFNVLYHLILDLFILPWQKIYNDATQLVQVFRHFRNQLDSSELDQSDNEGSLHSTLVDVS